MAQELAFHDGAFAAKFLEKASAAGGRFTPDRVPQMVRAVEEVILSKIAERTDVPFAGNRPGISSPKEEIGTLRRMATLAQVLPG